MKSYLQILRESRLRKEEVEALDEISRDLARSYIRKVADKNSSGAASEKEVMKRSPGVAMAGKKAYGIGGKAKVNATEEAELAEKKDMSKGDIAALAGHKGKVDAADFKALRNKEHLKKEEVEALDELSKDTLRSYKHRASMSEPEDDRQYKNRSKGIERASAKLKNEEVEQIDELSKKTLGSYVKKASYDAAGKAAMNGASGSIKNFSKTMDRLRNIKKATDRLTKEEVEQIDEISSKLLRKAADVADHNHQAQIDMQKEYEPNRKTPAPSVQAAGARAMKFRVAALRKDYTTKKEEVELDEKKLTAKDVKNALASAKAKPKDSVSLKKPSFKMEEVEAPVDMIAQLADFISRESKKK